MCVNDNKGAQECNLFLIDFFGRLNVPRFQDDAEGFVVAME